MDHIIEPIASYAAALRYEDIPIEVTERAKAVILDTIGCALGAAGSPPAGIVATVARSVQSSTPATCMVSGIRTSPDLAAFANGSLLRYLDYNDTYIGSGTVHPSDMLAPALAVAESTGADGRQLILGFVLGYEIFANLTDCGAMRIGPKGPQWDQSTYAVIAAAALSARMMGLTRDRIAHAVSLAAVANLALGQIRTGEISNWKGCAVGNSARNGVFAASLAAAGMTGPADTFAGPRGFFNATGGPFDLQPFSDRTGEFRLLRARVKPYPAGYYSQSAIEAMLELRASIGPSASIEKIHLETFITGFHAMGAHPSRWTPETRESADHSLPYVLAMALLEGGVSIDQYDAQRYRDPDVRALMAKIAISVSAEFSRESPDVALSVLHVDRTDGSRVTARKAHHLGHYSRPMDDDQLEAKFRPMAERHAGLAPEQVDRLLAQLRQLESVTDMAGLMASTVPRAEAGSRTSR